MDFDYNRELPRKLLHLSSSIIPLSILFLSKEFILTVLAVIGFIFVLIDWLRIKQNKLVTKYYNNIFQFMTRDKESNTLTGASYIFIVSLIVIYFCDKTVAFIALMMMSIADSLAALIGKKYGSVIVYKNKTLEGSIAFFLSSVLIVTLVPDVSLHASIIAIFACTVGEVFSNDFIDDNFSIPIIFSVVYSTLI